MSQLPTAEDSCNRGCITNPRNLRNRAQNRRVKSVPGSRSSGNCFSLKSGPRTLFSVLINGCPAATDVWADIRWRACVFRRQLRHTSVSLAFTGSDYRIVRRVLHLSSWLRLLEHGLCGSCCQAFTEQEIQVTLLTFYRFL